MRLLGAARRRLCATEELSPEAPAVRRFAAVPATHHGGVKSITAPPPTLGYIAPDGAALCEPLVHQELVDIEALGWRIIPIAIKPAQHSPRPGQDYARCSLVLQSGNRLRQWLSGLSAAIQWGTTAAASLRLLAADMRDLGLARARSWQLPGHWLAGARVARLLKARGCTHIHAHGAHDPAQIAMYAAAISGIPFTCMAYGNDLFRHGWLLPQKAQRARRLLTVSHFNKTWLEQHGVDGRQVDVIRCTPDASVIQRTGLQAARALAVQEDLQPASRSVPQTAPPFKRMRTGAYRIGTLARLVERKGVDDLMRALAQLIRSGCAPVKLLVAGEGPERLRLQVLADQLGIHPCVEFVGTIAPQAVAAWMRSLDLYVAAGKPDRHGDVDGIPLTLIEAMSLGMPVVATRITGVPELVLADQTGYLAEPGQPDSLATQIDRAMSEPERARSLGSAARAHVRWEFGREKNLRRLVSHFHAPSVTPETGIALEQAAA